MHRMKVFLFAHLLALLMLALPLVPAAHAAPPGAAGPDR